MSICPTKIFSSNQPLSSFYILDCKDWDEIQKVNAQAQSIGSAELPSALKNFHVINRDDFEAWKGAGAACTECQKGIKKIATCPFWERELFRPLATSHLPLPLAETIQIAPWTPRASNYTYSIIHLVFLIDMCALKTEPETAENSSEGIIFEFIRNDPQYALEILGELRKGPSTVWMRTLNEQKALVEARSEILANLKLVAKNLYSPGSYTKAFLEKYGQSVKLLELFSACINRPSSPLERCQSETFIKPIIKNNKTKFFSLRNLLLTGLLLFTFFYFFKKIAASFLKSFFFLKPKG